MTPTIRPFACCPLLLLLLATPAAAESVARPAADPLAVAAADSDDPNLWLEDVLGDTALAWVRARNADTEAALTTTAEFEALRARLLAVYDSEARIPYVSAIGARYYNHWQDGAHPKGLWRRTTPASYATETPEWETVLDLDALAAAEGVGYVFGGADCLPGGETRCLISLSPGGSDAAIVREFDLTSKAFVPGGFTLPEGKTNTGWIDRDTLFVGVEIAAGDLTSSGYPRVARRWKRGTEVTAAQTVFSGQAEDVSAGAYHDATPGFARDLVYRSINFYENEMFLLRGTELLPIPKPRDSNLSLVRDQALLELRSDLRAGGVTFPAGSLVATSFDALLKGKPRYTALFTPTATRSLAGVSATRDHVLLSVLDNVSSRVEVMSRKGKGWTSATIPGAPAFGQLGIGPLDAHVGNEFWLTVTDYLTPSTLMRGEIGKGPATVLKQLPAFFDATDMAAAQHFATSADGTRIPYFEVSRKAAAPGPRPTLLYGYGGFEVSLLPRYSATRGISWLERGGVYVVANIRGGGEFGPKWHQAALKEKRHRAYEDFAAVADDLVRRGVTVPAGLVAEGASNGGLLTGNMYTLYPERFGAILCGVPLLDMRRFSKLLAGASWMGEYGDPDDPAQWTFIQTFSPYHNFDASERHPPMLLTTSTRDDRVHPGHARKMAAKLLGLGQDILYWENIEGGHGGAADNKQAAFRSALEATFAWKHAEGGSRGATAGAKE